MPKTQNTGRQTLSSSDPNIIDNGSKKSEGNTRASDIINKTSDDIDLESIRRKLRQSLTIPNRSGRSKMHSGGSSPYTPEYNIRMAEIELEQRKIDAEQRRAEIDSERRRAEIELEQRKVEAEIERIRIQAELEITRLRKSEGNGNTAHHQDIENDAVVRFGKLLKAAAPNIPDKPEELPNFFISIEKLFAAFEVPDNVKGTIILPLLGNKVQPLLTQLSVEELSDYEKIKGHLLSVSKLSPSEYRGNFFKCRKLENESYGQFLARLASLWIYYEKSRNVENHEDLQDLILADKLRDTLPDDCKRYIMLHEGTDNLKAKEIAELAQRYCAAETEGKDTYFRKCFEGKQENEDRNRKGFRQANFQNSTQQDSIREQKWRPNFNNTARGNDQKYNSWKTRTCFICNGPDHISTSCPKRQRGETMINRVQAFEELPNDEVISASVSLIKSSILQRVPLQREYVFVQGKKILALVDSGSEIPIIKQNHLKEKFLEPCGRIFLQPAVGKPVECKLVKLNLSVEDPNDAINPVTQTETLMAVHEDLAEDLILPPKIYTDLMSQVESKDCEETTSVNGMQIKESKEIHDEMIHSVEDKVMNGKRSVQKKNDFANHDKTSSTETKIIINDQEMSLSEYKSDQRHVEDFTEAEKSSENGFESNISNSRQSFKTEQPTSETLDDCWQYAKKWKKKICSRTQLVVSRNLTRSTTKAQVKSALGFCGHNRGGVRDFATITQPLAELTSEKIPKLQHRVQIVHRPGKNSTNADSLSRLFTDNSKDD